MYRINEIFFSIQGEGPGIGELAVFVRFSGCNMSCDFCDTDHKESTEMAFDRMVDEIKNVLSRNPLCEHAGIRCIFTGGEPLLQLDLKLVKAVIDIGLLPCVETNGAVEEHENPEVLYALTLCHEVVVSPKGDCNVEVLRRATCLKILSPVETRTSTQLSRYVVFLGELRGNSIALNGNKNLILQPITPKEGLQSEKFFSNCEQTMNLAVSWKGRYKENWRVIPQTHKIMRLR